MIVILEMMKYKSVSKFLVCFLWKNLTKFCYLSKLKVKNDVQRDALLEIDYKNEITGLYGRNAELGEFPVFLKRNKSMH